MRSYIGLYLYLYHYDRLKTVVRVSVCQGINITGFVMATELFPPKERTVAAVSHEFFWALGGAILSGWAFIFRQWRHLQIIVSIPTILGLVLIWSVSQRYATVASLQLC